jgi:hypothetical protein
VWHHLLDVIFVMTLPCLTCALYDLGNAFTSVNTLHDVKFLFYYSLIYMDYFIFL